MIYLQSQHDAPKRISNLKEVSGLLGNRNTLTHSPPPCSGKKVHKSKKIGAVQKFR